MENTAPNAAVTGITSPPPKKPMSAPTDAPAMMSLPFKFNSAEKSYFRVFLNLSRDVSSTFFTANRNLSTALLVARPKIPVWPVIYVIVERNRVVRNKEWKFWRGFK